MGILITGAKGYIGSRLLKHFPNAMTIDKQDGQDINDYEHIITNESVDVVYHLAAQAGAIPSWDDPYQDAKDNILATIRIAEMFPGAKIIFTTSGAALEPESPYGLSKKAAEEYLRLLCPEAVILRLSSVFGNKDRGVVDTFINEPECAIYGDGSAVRDFVHVADVVEALVRAKDWEAGTYCIGSGVGTSVKEIAEATGKPISYFNARYGEKQKVVLPNEAPDGWKPKINVIDYVTEKCKES